MLSLCVEGVERERVDVGTKRVVDVEEDAGRTVGVRGEVVQSAGVSGPPSVVSTNVSDKKPLM